MLCGDNNWGNSRMLDGAIVVSPGALVRCHLEEIHMLRCRVRTIVPSYYRIGR